MSDTGLSMGLSTLKAELESEYKWPVHFECENDSIAVFATSPDGQMFAVTFADARHRDRARLGQSVRSCLGATVLLWSIRTWRPDHLRPERLAAWGVAHDFGSESFDRLPQVGSLGDGYRIMWDCSDDGAQLVAAGADFDSRGEFLHAWWAKDGVVGTNPDVRSLRFANQVLNHQPGG